MSQNLIINGKPVEFEVLERKGQSVRFTCRGREYRFTGYRLADGGFVLEQEIKPGVWQRISGYVGAAGRGGTVLQLGLLEVLVSDVQVQAQAQAAAHSAEARLSPLAPMPGMVRQVLVKKGDKVSEGQSLAVLEAMKLQLTLSAGGDATVAAVLVREGEMIAEGAELFTLSPEA